MTTIFDRLWQNARPATLAGGGPGLGTFENGGRSRELALCTAVRAAEPVFRMGFNPLLARVRRGR
jgi:hypothetical protein